MALGPITTSSSGGLELHFPTGSNPDGDRKSANRWLGCVAIFLTIPLILAFRWINFTLDEDLYGFAFSIFSFSPNHPTIVVCSFGLITALILTAAMLARAANKPGIYASLGLLLLLLLFWAYLRVAVVDAQLLVALARQSDWWLIIAGHPQPFARIEPGVWSQLAFDTVSDRLISGWYYLGLGWYISLFAGLAIAISPVVSGQIKQKGLAACAAIAGFTLLASVALIKPALAQRRFVSAVNFEAKGDLAKAREEYQKATALDPWYALNSRLYERIGALDAALGQINSREYKVYQAERIIAANQGTGSVWQLDLAVKLYDSIAETNGPIAAAAKLRAVDIRVLYGMHLFQDGSFGSAVTMWNAALVHEPYNWLAAFYLTLGYPTVNGYQDLLDLCTRFLVRCRDPLTTGILYNGLGTAQIQLGERDAGHQSFYTSYQDDYLNNRAAITSLIGP